MAIRLRYGVVHSEAEQLPLNDCKSRVDIDSPTLELVRNEFPSATAVSAWDEEEQLWVRLKLSSESMLKDGGFLRVLEASAAGVIDASRVTEMIGGIVPKPDQPEVPDVHASEEEYEREELSLGGSKSDFAKAEKALPRFGYQYLLEKRITADGTVASKFIWGPKREDDSSNMKRALPFLQQQLEKTCNSKFIAIDVSAKQLLPKAEATPGKKTTSKSFSTDVLLCPPELSARACENPRSCLSEALAIADFKKPVAFASRLGYVRGQALSQFILTSLAAGHDVPTMATDLGFNTRIYHSEGEGTDRHVKELVFHNVGQALTYFGAVVDQVQKHIAPALKLEEATKELQAISFAPVRALNFEGDDELDLFEAEHSEAQREGNFQLPPIGHAKDYVIRLHQGVLRALDHNALTPSYFS